MTNTQDDTLVLPAAPQTPTASAAAKVEVNIHLPPTIPTPAKVSVASVAMGKKPSSKPDAKAKSHSLFDVNSGYYLPILPTPILTIKPEYQTDAVTGARSTIYRDSSGAQAVFIADPSDHNKVTLKIKTKDGDELVTYGHERGFDATVKTVTQEADPFHVVRDTLTCGTKKADITANQTESVTRDKLQQFAKANPDLARVMKDVDLPVTVAGALPINFKQAVDKPTEYRACPTNDSGIVLERLTEKSAAR